MFIKLKKNASGSYSVQLIESIRMAGKKQPRPRLIKSFGSSSDHQEIKMLREQAQVYLDNLPSVQAISSTQGELVIRSAEDVESCSVIITGFKTVFNSLYNDIFAATGLKDKGNKILCDIATMRIAAPKSKRATANIADDFGINLELDSIYKLMDRIDDKIIEKVKTLGFINAHKLLKASNEKLEVLYYDLTTISFETNCQDAIREFGFSKDGKHQHVQIMLALIVTKSGLPIGYEIFKGNTYEGHTLIPTIKDLQKKYRITKITLVADSGLISRDNIKDIKELGLDYIIGGRVKNTTKTIQKEVFSEEGYIQLNDEVKAKKYTLNEQDVLYIYHSKTRARKDQYEREKSIDKVRLQVGTNAKNKLSGIYKRPYIKLSKESVIEIDEEKLMEASKYDGYFMLQTNIKNLEAQEILGNYQGLWQIEQTFRLSKYNIKIRPVFHYSIKRIKAHFAICYIALVLLRTLEYKTKLLSCYIPVEQLITLLQKVAVTTITSKGKKYDIAHDFPQELAAIYKCVKAKVPHRFISYN